MSNPTNLWRVLVVVALAALPLAAAQAAETANGAYSAKLEIKALRNEKSGRTPQLPFSGKFMHSGGKFRLDVLNGLTQETQVYIADSSSSKAWVLFPDTLNGLSASLTQADREGLVQQAQQFLRGDFQHVPKDWGKPVQKKETVDGKPATHLTYKLPKKKGTTDQPVAHFWYSAGNVPLRLVVDSAAMKLDVNVTDYVIGGKVDENAFVPDRKYTIRPLAKGERLPLPGGIPEGKAGAHGG